MAQDLAATEAGNAVEKQPCLGEHPRFVVSWSWRSRTWTHKEHRNFNGLHFSATRGRKLLSFSVRTGKETSLHFLSSLPPPSFPSFFFPFFSPLFLRLLPSFLPKSLPPFLPSLPSLNMFIYSLSTTLAEHLCVAGTVLMMHHVMSETDVRMSGSFRS